MAVYVTSTPSSEKQLIERLQGVLGDNARARPAYGSIWNNSHVDIKLLTMPAVQRRWLPTSSQLLVLVRWSGSMSFKFLHMGRPSNH